MCTCALSHSQTRSLCGSVNILLLGIMHPSCNDTISERFVIYIQFTFLFCYCNDFYCEFSVAKGSKKDLFFSNHPDRCYSILFNTCTMRSKLPELIITVIVHMKSLGIFIRIRVFRKNRESVYIGNMHVLPMGVYIIPIQSCI